MSKTELINIVGSLYDKYENNEDIFCKFKQTIETLPDTLEQTNDMKECYVWAYHQTNFDPLNPTKVEVKPVGKIPKGTAVVGAVRGAAAGAAIGSVTGNMGDGAAIGAINGVIRGRRASRNAKKQHINNNIQAASNAERNLKLNFNKAFSACIKAKGYSVE